MPLQEVQQQLPFGSNDTGNIPPNQMSKKGREKTPKKRARWSLGTDAKGRRISFGFRDVQAQKTFTTPSKEEQDGDDDFIDADENSTPATNMTYTERKRQKLMTLKEAQSVDLYTLLGVTKNASPAEIKRAYHKLSFTYHPDKAQHNVNSSFDSDENETLEIISPEDTTAMFSLIARAHEVLSDPLQRTTYDVYSGFEEKNLKSVAMIKTLKSAQAESDIELMQVEYAAKLEKEEQVDGIIIKEARYGAIPTYVSKSESIVAQCKSKTIDVMVPVQCMVEDSKLYIHSGESKRWLAGFYDPLPEKSSKERNLIVRYQFHGAMHQVVVGDLTGLTMPLRSHVYKAKSRRDHHKSMKAAAAAIESAAVVPLTEEEEKRKLRRQSALLIFSTIATVASIFLSQTVAQ